jgi:hypothetical protein
MSEKYIPRNGNIAKLLEELVDQNERVIALMVDLVNGIHRVEKQLEKITDEPIDDDEQEIC